jgi:hypothetical protein
MIIVVGEGIAGSSLVRHLDERGIEYKHIANEPPASGAAVALLRRAYHHGDQLALFDRSLELLKKWHTPVHSGGMVTNYRTPEREARHEEDWHVVPPLSPLVHAPLRGWAHPEKHGVAVGFGPDAGFYGADRVLWATGATVDPLGLTYGVTWIHQDPLVLSQVKHVRLHHFAPYKTIVAAWVMGEARLGSSSARTEAGALDQGHKMLQAAYDAGLINTLTGWVGRMGVRCKGSTIEQQQSGIHVYVGGFHRTGYAMAPAVTERVVEAL